jgi:hypothetical protein
VQEFDDIYDEETLKRYHNHELNRLLSARKDIGKRKAGAEGRPFKTVVKDRFIKLLLYYHRLYITYTLAGFLFDLDQSNICVEIFIRLKT